MGTWTIAHLKHSGIQVLEALGQLRHLSTYGLQTLGHLKNIFALKAFEELGTWGLGHLKRLGAWVLKTLVYMDTSTLETFKALQGA